ncbi:MAG: Nif3-like dinuclear metal center hexameric protein [Actinomycetota bacterium]|nr:Nif3-like dinuclear metal center hexameric protein [Actinomycetota bacterium]
MSTVGEIAAAIAEKTRPDQTPDWDPVGVQLGDVAAEAGRVGVCHEVTEAVVAAVERSPVDLLVSYHPLLFAKTNRITAGRSPEARAFRLIRSRVSLLITHTDFDAATGGSADALASLFRLLKVEPFGGDPETGLPDIGRVGHFEGTLAVLDAIASDAFGHYGLRISGNRHDDIDRVAVIPGSGGGFVAAAAEVADALVTGDVSHHEGVHAADLGLAIVDPGHTATERPGMKALVRMLSSIPEIDVIDLTSHDPRTWG